MTPCCLFGLWYWFHHTLFFANGFSADGYLAEKALVGRWLLGTAFLGRWILGIWFLGRFFFLGIWFPHRCFFLVSVSIKFVGRCTDSLKERLWADGYSSAWRWSHRWFLCKWLNSIPWQMLSQQVVPKRMDMVPKQQIISLYLVPSCMFTPCLLVLQHSHLKHSCNTDTM